MAEIWSCELGPRKPELKCMYTYFVLFNCTSCFVHIYTARFWCYIVPGFRIDQNCLEHTRCCHTACIPSMKMGFKHSTHRGSIGIMILATRRMNLCWKQNASVTFLLRLPSLVARAPANESFPRARLLYKECLARCQLLHSVIIEFLCTTIIETELVHSLYAARASVKPSAVWPCLL